MCGAMTESARPRATLGWAALLLGAALLALWVGWTGYIASDDALYYAGAERWLVHPPFAGGDHWSTRFPLVLAFAGVLAVEGRGFAAFATTALIFYAALLGVLWAYARGAGGPRVGWIAALLAATLPVVVAEATTVGVDLVEAALLLGGALALGGADGRAARGFGAGLSFGLAVLCRETMLLPMAGLGVLFLIGRPIPRRVLAAAGLGAALVLGLEALFQFAETGDALRRYAIAFHHDEHIDRAANLEGNLLVHPAVDPLLVLLVNNDFGLLFWLAGAGLVLGATRRLTPARRARLTVLAAMAGASFALVSALAHKLVLNPRYFMLPALWAVVVLALWLDRLGPRPRRAVLAAYTGVNVLMLGVANAHPRWDMEALVAAARAHPGEVVHADPVNMRHAALSLRFAGLRNVAPGAAGLVLAPEDGAHAGRVVARYPSPPTFVGAVVTRLGLAGLTPGPVRRRLLTPSPAMVLVRVPSGG